MFHRGLCLLLGLTILLGGIACASADGMEGFEFAEKIPGRRIKTARPSKFIMNRRTMPGTARM